MLLGALIGLMFVSFYIVTVNARQPRTAQPLEVMLVRKAFEVVGLILFWTSLSALIGWAIDKWLS